MAKSYKIVINLTVTLNLKLDTDLVYPEGRVLSPLGGLHVGRVHQQNLPLQFGESHQTPQGFPQFSIRQLWIEMMNHN